MSTVANLEEIVSAQKAEITLLKEVLEKLEHENKRLSDELAVLLRRVFSKKSERLDPNQLRFFIEELLCSPESPASEEELEETVRVKRRRRGHGRTEFPSHLPRETVELDLPEEDRLCPDCGEPMKEFGVETTERGHIIPARMLVKRYLRKKYACPAGHAVRTASLPPSLIEKCKYERSVYAHLAVAKYGDHLPLHRLSGIYKRQGFSLPKSTMWEMLRRVDEIAAQPVLRQMRKELHEERILQADETPVTVQLEDTKRRHQGFVWSYGIGGKRVLDFRMSRSRDGPSQFLRGWKGTLQTDGYSGYDEVTRTNGLTRAGCWAHARRKVKDALETGVTKAVAVLRPVQRLFWIERVVKKRAQARGLSTGQRNQLRADVRRRLSSRITKRIHERALQIRGDPLILPKSTLGKAVRYIDNQWGPLTCFLEDPDLEIHNNDSERTLRHVVTGRKNWLHFGSPRGGRVGCHLYSLVATCKALEINPQTYLEDLLEKVDTTPATEIARLTPWAWAREAAATRLTAE